MKGLPMPCSLLLSAVALLVLAPAGRAEDKKSGIVVDKEKRAVIIDAKVAPRKINDPAYMGKIYPIEVIACWAYPKGQKAHETVVIIDVKPSEVHKALESLGLKPGKPIKGDTTEVVKGPPVHIFIEVPGGTPRRVPVERTLVDPRSNKPMPKVKWYFTGSVVTKPDPAKPETVYGADKTGTLIAIFPVTDETVVQTSLTMKEEKYLKLETNTKVLPKEGTPVKLIIEAAK
jgi:hypothetical protein